MSATNHNHEIISDKERVMIERVLNEYNISANDMVKIRSAYKVDSNIGEICVKCMRHGLNKLQNEYRFLENLNNAGFLNTSKYYKTRCGNYFTIHGKYIFYVTSWIDGHEIDIDDLNEAINCVGLLAKFHLAATSFDTKGFNVKNNLKNWPKIFTDNLSDLERYRNCINRKKIKSQFDNIYLDLIDFYYDKGITALSVLNNSSYHNLSQEAHKLRPVCHGSFYYQNIIKKDNEYYLINFDSIIVDLHIVELSKFIRRLMCRQGYQWSFEKARCLLEHYSSIMPITKADLKIAFAILIFPYKFWKLGRKRYIKKKNWSEVKFTRKLDKIIRYSKEQQAFLDDFVDYINSSSHLNYENSIP